MVYSPQRRHASASLVMTIQALSVLQQFYTPNILVIFSRLLVQTQISMAPYVHPTRSLLALFLLVVIVNISAISLHLLDFYAGLNGGKGLILDFVGQSYPASLRRILLLDIALFLLQTIALVVGFITNHGSNIPSSTQFPFVDLLLPPTDIDVGVGLSGEDPVDLESGTMRHRKGKRGVDEDEDDNVVWLSEDYLEPGSSATTSRLLPNGTTIQRREPPLIFSLPFPHLLHLILSLPSPQPPRSFSGGTPADTPPPPPAAELPQVDTHLTVPTPTPTTAPSTGVTANDADDEEEDADNDEDDEGQRGSLSERNRARGTLGRGSDVGRIPGDYWIDRRSGT